MEHDNVPWILFVVVDHNPVGVSYRGPYLQALKFFRRVRGATVRRGILKRGILKKAAGSRHLTSFLG
jgi:hypothetical protein